MAYLDDFTHQQIAPRLMHGEQILGMAYMSVSDREANRFGVGHRLGAVTDRRIFLIKTEMKGTAPEALNLGMVEWWFEDIAVVKVLNPTTEFAQMAIVSRPGFGPLFQATEDAERISIYSAQHIGFANPTWLYNQFCGWFKQRVDAGAYPQTPLRAQMRDHHFRTKHAADAQKYQANQAATRAAVKKAPSFIAFGAALFLFLGALLCGYGTVRNFGESEKEAKLAASSRDYAKDVKEQNDKERLEGQAELSEEFAADHKQTAFITAGLSAACVLGAIGLLVLGMRLAKKANATPSAT